MVGDRRPVRARTLEGLWDLPARTVQENSCSPHPGVNRRGRFTPPLPSPEDGTARHLDSGRSAFGDSGAIEQSTEASNFIAHCRQPLSEPPFRVPLITLPHLLLPASMAQTAGHPHLLRGRLPRTVAALGHVLGRAPVGRWQTTVVGRSVLLGRNRRSPIPPDLLPSGRGLGDRRAARRGNSCRVLHARCPVGRWCWGAHISRNECPSGAASQRARRAAA